MVERHGTKAQQPLQLDIGELANMRSQRQTFTRRRLEYLFSLRKGECSLLTKYIDEVGELVFCRSRNHLVAHNVNVFVGPVFQLRRDRVSAQQRREGRPHPLPRRYPDRLQAPQLRLDRESV